MPTERQDPIQKVLRAARQSKSVTLTAREAKVLAVGLMFAAKRLRASEAPKHRWWRRRKG